jgi:hypothetical protein
MTLTLACVFVASWAVTIVLAIARDRRDDAPAPAAAPSTPVTIAMPSTSNDDQLVPPPAGMPQACLEFRDLLEREMRCALMDDATRANVRSLWRIVVDSYDSSERDEVEASCVRGLPMLRADVASCSPPT